jgi:hypothetical protein
LELQAWDAIAFAATNSPSVLGDTKTTVTGKFVRPALSVSAHKGDQFSTHAQDFGSAMSQSPEAILEGKKRPFTGAEFLESLRDGREVYIYGERVGDVTTHPAFRNSVASVALLYDALHDPKTKDVLTAPTDTGSGGYTHKFFKVARSSEEVIAQRDAIATWARITYGWMGRSAHSNAAFSIRSVPMPSSRKVRRQRAPGISERRSQALSPPSSIRRSTATSQRAGQGCLHHHPERDGRGHYVSGAKVVAATRRSPIITSSVRTWARDYRSKHGGDVYCADGRPAR